MSKHQQQQKQELEMEIIRTMHQLINSQAKFSPKTADWSPPEKLPQNWRILRRNEDAGFYQNRTGIKVAISCCVEADGKNWVHLSVSRRKTLPSWAELKQVKDLFLGVNALAIQVLPPKDEFVNDYEYCLHVYQCLDERPIPDFRKLGTI